MKVEQERRYLPLRFAASAMAATLPSPPQSVKTLSVLVSLRTQRTGPGRQRQNSPGGDGVMQTSGQSGHRKLMSVCLLAFLKMKKIKECGCWCDFVTSPYWQHVRIQ